MNEYLTDELASDSEDEKKLRTAESRALARNKKQNFCGGFRSFQAQGEIYKTTPCQCSTKGYSVPFSRRQFFPDVHESQGNGFGRPRYQRGPKATDICLVMFLLKPQK